jgi:hypothetical protein
MTGIPTAWSDTLWINGYTGGDVPYCSGLHFFRGSTPKMWVSTQTTYSTSYGTTYEIPLYGLNNGNTSGLYAGIFYDSNNTGYYIDPASGSYVNVMGAAGRLYTGYDSGQSGSVSCSNWFRSSDQSGWYNATYSGGIYMTDATWVRTYGSKNFYCSNDIAAGGNVTAYYSDERLKTKISTISNALEKVCSLEGFLYVENDLARSLGYKNKKQQVGVSAQQVKAVLPEAVSLAPIDMQTGEFDGEITSKSGEDYLTVDYSRLAPMLIEAIKEQQKQIERLNDRVNDLTKIVEENKTKSFWKSFGSK